MGTSRTSSCSSLHRSTCTDARENRDRAFSFQGPRLSAILSSAAEPGVCTGLDPHGPHGPASALTGPWHLQDSLDTSTGSFTSDFPSCSDFGPESARGGPSAEAQDGTGTGLPNRSLLLTARQGRPKDQVHASRALIQAKMTSCSVSEDCSAGGSVPGRASHTKAEVLSEPQPKPSLLWSDCLHIWRCSAK